MKFVKLTTKLTNKIVSFKEPADTCCQMAKEHDSGVDFCLAKQTLMQKSKSMSSLIDMRMERVENVKDVKNYLERVDEMIERKIKKMNFIQSQGNLHK